MKDIFPPFDPEGRHKKPKKRRMPKIPVRVVIPNLITLLALCAGLTGARLGIEERYEPAIMALLIAAFLDGIDGRVARLLKSSSRFGAELDSLADFVNFGAAPALILYMWSLGQIGNLGWIAALTFTTCMSLRLARFNVSLDDDKDEDENAEYKERFFVGVPAPAGAFLVLMPLYAQNLDLISLKDYPVLVMVYTLFIAFLVVSSIPTLSVKKFNRTISRAYVLPFLLLLLVLISLAVSYPWLFLSLIAVGYLLSIPITALSYRSLAREHQASVDDEETQAKEDDTQEDEKSSKA